MTGASPFAGTARFYSQYRAPYAPAALDFIVETYALDARHRVLDLGCGPGIVARPLSAIVGEVVAVDPDAEMIAEGARLAALEGRSNIRWLPSRAEDISAAQGTFRVVTLGQSFHWMERDVVLQKLAPLVESGGGLALLNPGQRRPQESWEDVAHQVVTKFLGQRPRHPKANPQEPQHEPALRRSEFFSAFTAREFSTTITRDVASILGCVYSGSGSAKALFGDKVAQFEAEFSAALLARNPSGIFAERIDTEVIIAPKQIG